MTIAEALRRYRQAVGPARADQSVAVIQRYLDWGGTNTDASLRAYCRHLADQGYRSSTIDWHARLIRAFYRHLDLPAPRYRPPHDASGEDRPAVSVEWVHAWIAAVRAQDWATADQQLVLISTLYGCRVGELAWITEREVDPDQGRLYIRAEKHSQSRWYWLPPAPIAWRPWPQRSRAACYATWQRTVAAAGLPDPAGVGWHAVRRALSRALTDAGCSPWAVTRFLRWTPGDRQWGQLPRYAQPTRTIGPSGPVTASPTDPASPAYDAEIWARHPFLGDWDIHGEMVDG